MPTYLILRAIQMRIETFKEFMNDVAYSWDYPNYDIIKYNDGSYSLNKLYIEPTHAHYKTETWEISPEVFEQFEAFVRLLEFSSDKHSIFK